MIAALHVLLADAGRRRIAPPLALEAIDFSDEDGTLVGLLGSWALTGTLTREALAAPRGGREALLAGLARAGLEEDRLFDARRDPASLAAYLELHIEQGPLLERAGAQIGVVTSIVGSQSMTLEFRGAARHAGHDADGRAPRRRPRRGGVHARRQRRSSCASSPAPSRPSASCGSRPGRST